MFQKNIGNQKCYDNSGSMAEKLQKYAQKGRKLNKFISGRLLVPADIFNYKLMEYRLNSTSGITNMAQFRSLIG